MSHIHDLIFCPLDMPAPPVVDRDVMSAWIHTTERMFPDLSISRQPMEKHWNIDYPWEVAYAVHTKHSHDAKHYMNNFDVLFPELYAYFHTFPYKKITHIAVMRQKYDMAVPPHSDQVYPAAVADLRHYCMRCYLWNDFTNDSLYVMKTKHRADFQIRTIGGLEHVVQEKIYPKFPRRDYLPWMINSGTRAFHGVDAGGTGNRCSVLFGGELDHTRLMDLLARSVEKYADYALWW